MKIIIAFLYSSFLTAQVFPGAAGFGSEWTFPTDVEIRVVTNLNNTGAGSLRDAMTAATSNEGVIVVFNGLSGTITVSSNITLPTAFKLYVAGQTSENGILIRMADGVEDPIMNCGAVNGIIIRGISFAVGSQGALNVNGDNITLNGGSNVILDRCSFFFSTDESVTFWGVTNVTIQRSLIALSLLNSTHADGPHSMGFLVGNGANNTSIYKNVFAHNNQRNPAIGGSPIPGIAHEFVKNILYNWGEFGFTATGTGARINVINNYVIDGSDTSTARYGIAVENGDDVDVFPRDNITAERTSEAQAEADAIGCEGGCTNYMQDPADASTIVGTAFNYPLKDEAYQTPASLKSELTGVGGVGIFSRHSLETTVLGQVSAETGGAIIDDESEVGGYPTISAGTAIDDADSDGIPDEYEGVYSSTFTYVNDLADDTLLSIGGGLKITPSTRIRIGSGTGKVIIGN